jgi:hypothetical protein
VTTKREYDQAKRDHAAWTDEQHAEPTEEMLATVKVIHAYERTQDRREQDAADRAEADRLAAERAAEDETA